MIASAVTNHSTNWPNIAVAASTVPKSPLDVLTATAVTKLVSYSTQTPHSTTPPFSTFDPPHHYCRRCQQITPSPISQPIQRSLIHSRKYCWMDKRPPLTPTWSTISVERAEYQECHTKGGTAPDVIHGGDLSCGMRKWNKISCRWWYCPTMWKQLRRPRWFKRAAVLYFFSVKCMRIHSASSGQKERRWFLWEGRIISKSW